MHPGIFGRLNFKVLVTDIYLFNYEHYFEIKSVTSSSGSSSTVIQ